MERLSLNNNLNSESEGNMEKPELDKNQEIELELTFLAREIPHEIEGVKPKRIMDVYIPETAEHAELRLRQKGDKYEITKKTLVDSDDASSQIETTISLTQEEFEAIATLSKKRVVKDRYNVKIDGHAAEVDVFRDLLTGLVVVDFEFDSEEEKQSFQTPSIALADVTQEDFIAGGMLSGKSYEDILPKLQRFNYKKLVN